VIFFVGDASFGVDEKTGERRRAVCPFHDVWHWWGRTKVWVQLGGYVATQAASWQAPKEEKLIPRQRGDEQAVRSPVFRRYQRPVVSDACGCWGNARRGKNALQTAALSAYRNLSALRAIAVFDWLTHRDQRGLIPSAKRESACRRSLD